MINIYITKSKHVHMYNLWSYFRSRDGSVGIVTRYGLEGPGIESRWRRDFPHLSRPAPRPTQPPVQWVPGLSRGKGGRGVVLTTHPHLACRGSRKRVELYLYSPWEVFKACNRVGPSLYFTTDTFSCLQLALFLTFFNNISSKQSRVSWRQTRYLSRYSYYATGWTTKELRFDSLIGKGSIFYSKLSWPQLGSSQSSINDCPRVIFPEGNRMGHESDHSPPSSNKFKNEWSYTSAPPICLHRVDRDNFTFFAFIVV